MFRSTPKLALLASIVGATASSNSMTRFLNVICLFGLACIACGGGQSTKMVSEETDAGPTSQDGAANDAFVVDQDAARTDDPIAMTVSQCEKRVEDARRNYGDPPGSYDDVAFVKAKLAHMVEIDQLMRACAFLPGKNGYDEEETKRFYSLFGPALLALDAENTEALKEILAVHSWIVISKFGQQADKDAWLLVQHADHDYDFQNKILVILEELWPKGETNKTNYAYLYDRVAASWQDASRRKLQRYGTQGQCTGPGTWEPIPIEDPENLDARRKTMGLPPMVEYLKRFESICKQDQRQ